MGRILNRFRVSLAGQGDCLDLVVANRTGAQLPIPQSS